MKQWCTGIAANTILHITTSLLFPGKKQYSAISVLVSYRNKVKAKISRNWLAPETISRNCRNYWKTSWLNKASVLKYFLSFAFFVLNMHRYDRSLNSSRNKSDFIFFYFERPQTSKLCPHPQNRPFASISLQRPTWTQSKAHIHKSTSSLTTEKGAEPFQLSFPFSFIALPVCIGY